MITPREPTKEELEELHEYLLNAGKIGEGFKEFLGGVAVFDKYITDCPDYSGKVLVVIWSGSPCFHEVFIWNKEGQIEKCPIDDSYVGWANE